MEAAYLLVQDQLQKGLVALKAECQEAAKQQEGLIRSHMDEIISSRAFLAGKLRGMKPHYQPIYFCNYLFNKQFYSKQHTIEKAEVKQLGLRALFTGPTVKSPRFEPTTLLMTCRAS